MDDQSKRLLGEIRDIQSPKLEPLGPGVFASLMGLRFSLRALLIGITIIAFFFGVIGAVLSLAKKASPPAQQTQPPPTMIKQF